MVVHPHKKNPVNQKCENADIGCLEYRQKYFGVGRSVIIIIIIIIIIIMYCEHNEQRKQFNDGCILCRHCKFPWYQYCGPEQQRRRRRHLRRLHHEGVRTRFSLASLMDGVCVCVCGGGGGKGGACMHVLGKGWCKIRSFRGF